MLKLPKCIRTHAGQCFVAFGPSNCVSKMHPKSTFTGLQLESLLQTLRNAHLSPKMSQLSHNIPPTWPQDLPTGAPKAEQLAPRPPSLAPRPANLAPRSANLAPRPAKLALRPVHWTPRPAIWAPKPCHPGPQDLPTWKSNIGSRNCQLRPQNLPSCKNS